MWAENAFLLICFQLGKQLEKYLMNEKIVNIKCLLFSKVHFYKLNEEFNVLGIQPYFQDIFAKGSDFRDFLFVFVKGVAVSKLINS